MLYPKQIMIIGVDVDDVLAYCAQAIISWHNRVYITNTKYSDLITFDLAHVWKVSYEERVKRCGEFLCSEECAEQKIVNGAVEGIDELSKKYKLIIVTSRTKSKLSEDWIDKYFPNKFEKRCYNNDWDTLGPTSNKLDVCKENNIDVLIEDCLENAEKVAKGGITAILINYPWNQSDEKLHKNIIRVKNWKEIVEQINSLE
jgi:uncharacterized HAD superfamily protein